MEAEIGKVVHYFDKAMVAVIALTGDIKTGDTVKFVLGNNEFVQKIESMQVDHEVVDSVGVGGEVAVKVDQVTHENARVYKITE